MLKVDIAKCDDGECPRANSCWRFTSPPNQIPWNITPERKEGAEACDLYWPATHHPETERICYPPVTDKDLTNK